MPVELEGAPGPRHHGGDDKTCRVVGNFDLRAFLCRLRHGDATFDLTVTVATDVHHLSRALHTLVVLV